MAMNDAESGLNANFEVFKAANEMFAKATCEYLEKIQQLTKMYKRELAMTNTAIIVAAHTPGIAGVMLKGGQFEKDAVRGQCIWGEKHICDQLLEHLAEEART